MKSLELRIPPVALTLLFALAMYGVSWAAPYGSVQVPAKTLVASCMALLGGLVALAGVIEFRRKHTTVNPMSPSESSVLVSSGIYRHSRNPMYFGFLLMLTGWSIYLANGFTALLLPMFVVYVNQWQIRPEEQALEEAFGSQFQAFKSSVRRWI
jgi:protein-S-isoprenylcysteine O-methyltransferase Ste14